MSENEGLAKMHCKHQKVEQYLTGQYYGGIAKCLVGHFRDGKPLAQCIQCPDCYKWIGHDEQAKMLNGEPNE